MLNQKFNTFGHVLTYFRMFFLSYSIAFMDFLLLLYRFQKQRNKNDTKK